MPRASGHVVAVIVTYRPDSARVEEVLRALGEDVDGVVIVDNGSESIEEERWRAARPRLVLRRLEANLGIAAAQNQGVAAARELGASHVLMLDQDSVPGLHMVPALFETLESLLKQDRRVACVGPVWRAHDDRSARGFTRLGWLTAGKVNCESRDAAIECDFLIASGSLIPLRVWDDVGDMEEQLFIDLVDTEWCLRARSKGYGIYGACAAVLEHKLGETTQRVWLGSWRPLSRHKPFRYYYIFRNVLFLARRGYVPVKVKIFHLKWLAGLLLAFGIFGGGGGELRMMLRGIRDSFRGVTGKLEQQP